MVCAHRVLVYWLVAVFEVCGKRARVIPYAAAPVRAPLPKMLPRGHVAAQLPGAEAISAGVTPASSSTFQGPRAGSQLLAEGVPKRSSDAAEATLMEILQGQAAAAPAAADVGDVDRRGALLLGGSAMLASTAGKPSAAEAADVKTVVVAGATGQTGRRVLERLSKVDGVNVIGGVRDVKDAQKKLAEAKVELRGLMMDRIDAVVDTKGMSLKRLDVVKDSVDAMAATMQGANALVITTGFVPGNPFELSKEAHAVDNLGTVALVDAAKKAGVGKVVLVTSILTNARAWGQENSPGFLATNVFGGVLDEKLVAEKYLRASGLDYTIVRPGGLKSTPPSGNLVVNKEDTTSGAEVSRDLVADVCIASLFDTKASNKVVEIIEDDNAPKLEKSQWFSKLV